ncbi:MAG: penicillin-binding protein [Nocardioidaceae bacterium]|nr:penicillin-binding protein [Nocardioidaceae bacterium]
MRTAWRSRRTDGGRGRVGAVVAILTLSAVACTGGGGDPTPGDETTAEPAGAHVIEQFAAAWADADVASFQGIVDNPAAAARDIAAHVTELVITATSVQATGELDCVEESCSQYLTVTHQLAGADQWSYETLVKSKLRQGQWVVEWLPGTFHPDLTRSTSLERTRTLPPRAPILDRTGVALTPEREIVRVGVEPRDVRRTTYAELASVLEIDTASLEERVRAAQPSWFVSVIDLRRAAFRQVSERLLDVPGVVVDTSRRALAPTAEWGRSVLGTVGPATSDSLATAGPLALPIDEVGASGLQLAYQEQLAGTPGISIDLVERASGEVLNEVLRRPPVPGQPLDTSLDFSAQSAAEKAVVGATDTTAVVVVKASTGEVLASANGPGASSYPTGFIGHYAPGSTFKVVSAAALIDQGAVKPSSRVTCPDTTVVDGKRFKNYERGIASASPTFAQAFAASCNTTMVERADDLNGTQLAKMAARFGVGAEWQLGLDAFSGSAPADADLVTRAADMIGQGRVEASPLLMAMIAATVDSGVARTPTLLPELAPGTRLRPLDPDLLSDLQQMMRLTVTDGTGSSVDLPGLPVHAKTGTAEYDEGGQLGTNAWMIGYRGDLAFAVLVENGSSGAQDAGPVVKRVLQGLPADLYN